MKSLRIHGQRLLQMLASMAEIGPGLVGGCNRQALTDADRDGRALFLKWCRAIGGEARLDQMGNLFVRWAGKHNDWPTLLMGSHLDTQPSGGRYDGVYGVLGALEVMQTLHAAGEVLQHPVEVVVWMNEEGARFAPAMMGSGVFAGALDQHAMYAATDKQGVSVLSALQASAQLGTWPCRSHPIAAALELHIEQGPVLEARGLPIGIVSGVQGMHWFDLTLTGATTHAGPTPMSMRRDPVQTLLPLLQELYAMVLATDEQARITIGDLKAHPGSRNTVPSLVSCSVDLRHPDQAILDEMTGELYHIVARQQGQIDIQIKEIWRSPAVAFHSRCIEAVSQAAGELGYQALSMVSGAGHDSVYLSRIAPVGMIFIPCQGGISHNEQEYASAEHLAQGANVLLQSLLLLDAQSPGEADT